MLIQREIILETSMNGPPKDCHEQSLRTATREFNSSDILAGAEPTTFGLLRLFARIGPRDVRAGVRLANVATRRKRGLRRPGRLRGTCAAARHPARQRRVSTTQPLLPTFPCWCSKRKARWTPLRGRPPQHINPRPEHRARTATGVFRCAPRTP